MSYSVIGHCPRTNRVGLGVASYSLAVGLYCDASRANTGVVLTLGAPNPGNNGLGLRLLAQGFTPPHVLSELLHNGPAHAHRQVSILDRAGNPAAYSGDLLRGWSGHRTGPGYVAAGNMLQSADVVDAIAAGFTAASDADLEERLLRALEAGRDAGGQRGTTGPLPARSAAFVVFGSMDYSDWDLRVDMHAEAVGELRRVHEEFKPNAAYYLERARRPQNAIPAMEFADMLKSGRTAP
jgi:uncharacterized Ntn-hydrolase superfamily protein